MAGSTRIPHWFIIKLYSETQVSGRLGMSGGISPRHAQNPLSGERRKTLSITHHAISTPPSHHHLYIIHLINWLQRFYRIIMSLKRPFVPKSDVKQLFTTTTTTPTDFFYIYVNMLHLLLLILSGGGGKEPPVFTTELYLWHDRLTSTATKIINQGYIRLLWEWHTNEFNRSLSQQLIKQRRYTIHKEQAVHQHQEWTEKGKYTNCPSQDVEWHHMREFILTYMAPKLIKYSCVHPSRSQCQDVFAESWEMRWMEF